MLKLKNTLYLTSFSLLFFYKAYACMTGCDNFSSTVLPNGTFVTVWQQKIMERFVIQSSSSEDGETWDEPKIISLSDQNSLNPVLESDDKGNLVAIWRGLSDETENFCIVANILPADGEWGTAAILSDPEEVVSQKYQLQISAGKIVVIWNTLQNLPDEKCYKSLFRSSSSDFSGKWSKPITINNRSF